MAAPLASDQMDQVCLLAEKLQRVLEERKRLVSMQRVICGEGKLLANESSTLVQDCRLARETRLRARNGGIAEDLE